MTQTLGSLTHTLLQSPIPANDLVDYLEGILVLRKKYGKKIYYKEIITTIEAIDIGFASLLRLLVTHSAKESKDIKQIIRHIKLQRKDYTQQFIIRAPKEKYTENIKNNMQEMFPESAISHTSNLEVGIEISGEGWHYKRNLEQDIEKLLGTT